MIKGIGTDILEVSRFESVIHKRGQKFLEKIFHPEELKYCYKFKDAEVRLAARFSAKEAISKALGTGFGNTLSFQDIEIKNDDAGKPVVFLSSQAKKQFNDPQILLSISHCKQVVTAVAVWQ